MRNTNESIPQKSIFSCNIYRPNNQSKSLQRTPKPTAILSSAKPRDPEVLFLNRNLFKSSLNKGQDLRECCTQTSKTILELAQNEVGGLLQKVPSPNCQLIWNHPEASRRPETQPSKRPETQPSKRPETQAIKTPETQASKRPETPIQKQSQKVPRMRSFYGVSADQNIVNNYDVVIPGTLNNHNELQNVRTHYSLSSKNKSYQLQTIPLLTKNAPVPTENGPISQRMTIQREKNNSPVRIGVQIEILGKDKSKSETETGYMTPDSLAGTPKDSPNHKNYSLENCPYSVASQLSGFTIDGSCHEQDCIFNAKEKMSLDKPLTQTYLEKSRTPLQRKEFKSRSFIDTYQHPNYIQEPTDNKVLKVLKTHPRINRKSSKSLDLPDNSFERLKPSVYPNSNFMHHTTASRIKSQMEEIQSANCLLPAMRRGRSISPKATSDKRRFESSKKIPYIDQSKSDVSSSTTLINATRNPELFRMKDIEVEKSDCSNKLSDDVLSMVSTAEASNSSFNDTSILVALNKLQEHDWRVALRGLAEIVEICRTVDGDLVYEYMAPVNHRLIQLLKSPRSHVSRIACQAAGHLFEYVKDTRRPIFDEMVDLLLYKTADANKFIRNDANMALDCMVTHISTFNAVRALCAKGPYHKNSLVRSATARLLVCAVVLAGTDVVMNPANSECTRKRIMITMARFLEDKNLETRKLAERLYKVLSKDGRFHVYLKKYLEPAQITKIQNNLRLIHKK